jgi:hypothetical protein
MGETGEALVPGYPTWIDIDAVSGVPVSAVCVFIAARYWSLRGFLAWPRKAVCRLRRKKAELY